MAGQTTNYLFDYPTSTDYVKDGATAIETLADDVDATLFTALGGAYPGLRLIKKQTIGSGVSSVTVTGAFSATYENYKIVVTGGAASANDGLALRMNGATTGYYGSLIYTTFTSNTVIGLAQNNNASLQFMGYLAGGNGIYLNCDILSPNLPKPTTFSCSHVQTVTTGVAGTSNGFLNTTTAYTAFDIVPQAGTLTGGTIYVYGYGAS